MMPGQVFGAEAPDFRQVMNEMNQDQLTHLTLNGPSPETRLAAKRLKAKMDRERQDEELGRMYEIPAILQRIEENDAHEKAAKARIDEVAMRLQQAPPNMAAQLNPSMGEGISLAIAALLGGAQPAAQAVAAQTAGRQKVEFENALRGYETTQRSAGIDYERAIREAEQARERGLMDQERLDRAKQGLMNRRFFLEDREFSQADELEKELRGQRYQIDAEGRAEKRDLAAEERAVKREKELIEFRNAAEFELRGQLEQMGQRSEKNMTRFNVILKQLTESMDPDVIPEILAGFDEDFGTNLSRYADLLTSAARDRRNSSEAEAEFKRRMYGLNAMETAAKIRSMEADAPVPPWSPMQGSLQGAILPPVGGAQASGGAGVKPGSPEFFAVESARGAASMPDLGGAKSAYAAVIEKQAEADALMEQKAALDAKRQIVETVQGGLGIGTTRGGKQDRDKLDQELAQWDAAWQKLRAEISGKRQVLNQLAPPEWKQWRESARQLAKATISELSKNTKLDGAARKAEIESVKRWYRSTTGENEP